MVITTPEYELIFSLFPNSPSPYFSRGLVYLKHGDYEEAIADYNEAIAIRAEANSYFNRGTAYIFNGQLGLGLNDYLEGVRLQGQPPYPEHSE